MFQDRTASNVKFNTLGMVRPPIQADIHTMAGLTVCSIGKGRATANRFRACMNVPVPYTYLDVETAELSRDSATQQSC